MKKIGIIVVVALCVLSVRCYFVYQNLAHKDADFSSHKVSLKGYIDEDPDVRDTRQRIVVRVVKVTSGEESLQDKRVVMSVPKYPTYTYGTELHVSGVLEIPEDFETERGDFKYRAYLAAKDIWYDMKNPRVKATGNVMGNVVVRTLTRFKKAFVKNLERVLGEPQSSLAAGLLVGEKHSLSDQLLTGFRRVGLTHIIVLSGYNIAIVVRTIALLLSWLPRWQRIVLSALSVILFSILVGGGATVIRSLFMAIIALSGEFLKRDYSPLRALLIAGYIMVFHNPLIAAYDPSFQLSFLATIGLILLGKRIEKRLSWLPEKFGIRELLASTCATQITVLPLILYLSGSISVGGTLVNFLVLPLVPITMLSVLITGITGFVSYWCMYIAGVVSHMLLSYELLMVTWWSKFSWMSVSFAITKETTILWYGVYLAILIGVGVRNYFTERT